MNIRPLYRGALAALLLHPLAAQETQETAAPADIGWPREFKTATHSVIVYQPQVEEWKDHKTLDMRIAVGIAEIGKESDESAVRYGGLFAEVTTDVNSETGQVLLTDRKVTRMVFSDADEAEQKKLAAILKSALPDKQDMIVSLDRVVAAVADSQQQMQGVEASAEVPPIYVSQEPALLLMFIGEPVYQPVADTGLLFATNTNWDAFMTTGEKPIYFLRADDTWYKSSAPKDGVWLPAGTLPAGFAKLPADDNWSEVRANLPGKPASQTMKVFYSDRPAELVVIEGAPAMKPLVGNALMYVSNTEADMFFHPASANYYFLTAGRWFTNKSLTKGPWRFATEALPAEFSQIPEDSEKGEVLASVIGTPAAQEALIMATIPETATINRSEATLEVVYDGDPMFAEVPGTEGVEFAVNTNFDVFRVNNYYYCCFEAVWFVSAKPAGPWVVCDSVAEPIYTIPAEHPKHNVTYVAVKDSTPTTVQTTYTSGYNGNYVVNGLVMFGLGYWIAKDKYKYSYPYHYYYRYGCRPAHYGYGCRARYYRGGYYRAGGRYYGPYGGAGRGAVYNPRTGGWARGGYAYGPRGSVSARAAYNPYSNTFGKQVRATTPYGSWSKGAVSRNGNWARGGTATTRRGSVGAATGSRGGSIVHADKRFGGQGTIAKTPRGDVYVGRNGEVNKLNPKTNTWQTRQGSTWKNTDRSSLTRTPSTGPTQGRIDTSKRPGSSIGTRPSTGTRPATPTRPSTGTRPTTPTRPTTRPTTPTRPSTGTRPTTPTRPTTRPTTPTRPTTRPTTPTTPTRPTTRPSTPSRTSQLDRQAFSRHRGTQTTSRSSSRSFSRSSSRSAPSRGGGGRRGR